MYCIMHNSPDCDPNLDVICATHPAQAGTYMCWPNDDAIEFFKEPVILWAVMEEGWLAPMTIAGVWGGSDDTTKNKFVLFPDGSCSLDGCDFWASAESCLQFIREKRLQKSQP